MSTIQRFVNTPMDDKLNEQLDATATLEDMPRAQFIRKLNKKEWAIRKVETLPHPPGAKPIPLVTVEEIDCDHDYRPTGSHSFSGGEVSDDIVEQCIKCGHVLTVAQSTDEIPS